MMKNKKEDKVTSEIIEQQMKDDKVLCKLKEHYDLSRRVYGRLQRKMQMLDATDKGELWKTMRAKFPSYQLLPDSNFVSYVKSNILASLYTVTKSAELVPTSEEDAEICTFLNIALEHEWDRNTVGYYQFLAGERAALTNMGITQVLWDSKNDEVSFANIDPIKFMRDPYAKDLDTASWCVIYDKYHKTVFENSPLYSEKFKQVCGSSRIVASTEQTPSYRDEENVADSEDHYNLFIWWVKNKTGGIDEIHTLDNEFILHRKENIKPNCFPFAILYCNLPGSSLIGVSEPQKIFANNLAYNLMTSISLTTDYKNQRPPKFINRNAGINIAAFSKYGNEADRTFPVNGDASKAVHYQQFPAVSPTTPGLLDRLSQDIETSTGVDGRYTGRDTGSIITTGGTEEMLNRVTLIDTPKVLCYEAYTKQLTELVLKMLIAHGPTRNYFYKPKNTTTNETDFSDWETIEVSFPDIPEETVFDYAIQISSELPKNKQRVAAWANTMMEKQMQYQKDGVDIEIITPEEWLRYQDVPYKEPMLERMGMQKVINNYIKADAVISEFAGLVEQGASPEEATLMAAQALGAVEQGQMTPMQEMEAATMAQTGTMNPQAPIEEQMPIE